MVLILAPIVFGVVAAGPDSGLLPSPLQSDHFTVLGTMLIGPDFVLQLA